MNIDQAQNVDLKQLASTAMRAHGLEPDFTRAAIAEAQAASAGKASDSAVQDLRSLLWSSIDNDDSLDLDQIEVAEVLDQGRFRLRVGIADVDSVVKVSTAIDTHARVNTTSVYTAAQNFPMLPVRLSTDLTSLAENQDRLCIVIEMTLDQDGSIAQSALYRALARNHAKLAYHGVGDWLEGGGPIPARAAAVAGLEAQLRLQQRIATLLKAGRERKGALQFSTLESRAVYSGGALIDLQPERKDIAHDIIEEFMVAANGVTARYFQEKGRTSLRRILRTPKRWERIVQMAREAGESLPETPDALALNEFLVSRQHQDPAGFADLSLAVIKCLGAGEYVAAPQGRTPEGHFGLAVREYTHSTAPNRRFPDLITQRLLKAALSNSPAPYDDVVLAELAAHCTEQERNAQKVERQMQKSVAAMLLGPRVGARFDGIVTGASEKGVWVRIQGPTAEGRIIKGLQGLDVGDRVKVRLLHVDVARGFIDFEGLK